MKRALIVLLSLLLLIANILAAIPQPSLAQGITSTPTADDSGYKVVGYFVQWGMYSRNYRIKQVKASGAAEKLTHILYAFANVSTDSRCYEETRLGWGDASADYEVSYSADQSVDGMADETGQPIKGHFNQIKKLKVMYPKLKVLISIGGFTWSGRFSDAALPQNREAFVRSCLDLFIKGNMPMSAFVSGGTPTGEGNTRAAGVFDGIDIDWEYPAAPGFPGDPARSLPANVYRPEDTQNFTALLIEFRRQLDELGKQQGKHYLLTIATPAGEQYKKFELDKISQVVDFINLMTYNMHGAWPGEATGPTNFQAPLFSSSDDPSKNKISVDSVVSAYLKAGVPPKKLVVGVPFYGRGWTNVPNKGNGLYQSDPAMVAAPGKYEAGIDDYRELVKLSTFAFRDPKTQSNWIFDGKTFWNFDDPETLAAKAKYIKEKQLGGAMFWSLDGDNEKGTLISAIHNGLNGK